MMTDNTGRADANAQDQILQWDGNTNSWTYSVCPNKKLSASPMWPQNADEIPKVPRMES